MKITKAFIRNLLDVQIGLIRTGEIKWNVANQHDEYILRDALKNLEENFDRAVAWFSESKALNVMDWAFFLAEPCDGKAG